MIRDYFGKIRKIIYNNQISKYGLYDNVDVHEIDQIVQSNITLLKRISNQQKHHSKMYVYQEGGDDIQNLGNDIDRLETTLTEHKASADRFHQEFENEIKNNNPRNDIRLIGEDAVTLIKFLHELIQQSTDPSKREKLIEIQRQIANIVVELSKYLEDEEEKKE